MKRGITKQEIHKQVKISTKKYNCLKQRMHRTNTTIINYRGMTSQITTEHIEFMKKWFSCQENVGKPFKWVFKALKDKFLFDQKGITIK